jgi:hypothetical protein
MGGERKPGVAFIPMPELEFVRDANLRHLLRTMRSNIRAAHGLDGGGFATKAQLAALSEGRSKDSRSVSGGASPGASPTMAACFYDASSGVGGEGTHYLNAILPANCVLIRAFCVVQEAFAGTEGATLSIRAGDAEDEIEVFADSLLDPEWAEGYHASNSIGQSARERARAFKAVVSGGDISAGRLKFFAEFVGA